jgi:hypothetical protein
VNCDYLRRTRAIAHRFAAFEPRMDDLRNRNTDAARHPKLQLYLVIQENLARIQAAGGNGFVKSLSKEAREFDDEAGATCDEAKAVITVSVNSDRRLEDDG